MPQENILDNHEITNHSAEISIKNGHSFTTFVRYFSLVFVLFGFAIILSLTITSVLVGVVIVTAALFIFSSEYGTDISVTSNYIREYHKRFFFLKTGNKWIPLSPFSDVCILRIKKTRQLSDVYGVSSNAIDATKNEVYVMTHDHRRRFLVKICNSQQEAIEFATTFAKKFDKTFSEFNPKISETTKKRIASRR